MIVSYWHKNGIEVYRVKNSELTRIASGNLDTLKPFTGFGKKVMIVARELLLYTRKRYPPTTRENIAKAISIEIRDIFPLESPAYFFRVSEQTATYSLVDIWAWDCSQYEGVRKVFPFTHVLPEDMAFISDEPEISIFEHDGLKHLVASNKNGFIGGLSLRTLTDDGIEMFLRSLGRHSLEIKRIRLYCALENFSSENFSGTLPVVNEQQKDYPPCLKNINRLVLKNFRYAREIPFTPSIKLLLRLIIYFMIIYSFSLFITTENYDSAIQETSKRLDSLTKELTGVGQIKGSDDHSDIINELIEKRKSRIGPLAVMDALAEFIPEGTSITRMILNENNLELSLSSKDPLNVIRNLSGARCVKTVKLKGAPYKAQDSYNFLLTLELVPCG